MTKEWLTELASIFQEQFVRQIFQNTKKRKFALTANKSFIYGLEDQMVEEFVWIKLGTQAGG